MAHHFDAALIARYDGNGPRYTSYPTALHFAPSFDEAALRKAIAATNNLSPPRPLSAYIHVPFCHSPCFYCGCNRVITRDANKSHRYLSVLSQEVARLAPLFHQDRSLHQLHLGGGTPNSLDIDQMTALMAALERHFHLAPPSQREFGFEMDPRHADADYVSALARLGFNRLSVGIQDFSPAVQAAVNRLQSPEQTRRVIEAARTNGFRSISVDLMYGLPRQTQPDFARTLDTVLSLAPDRLAVYGYAHLPHLFRAQSHIKAEETPSAAERLDLFGQALETLTGAGYVYIGMDHFALPGDDLVRAQRAGTLQRNFQGYSTFGHCDIVGLGPSAISRIGDTYSQSIRDLAGYSAAVLGGNLPVARGIALTADDRLRREVINTLMCDGELDMLAFSESHHLDFPSYFGQELVRLYRLGEDGLVAVDDRRIRVTPTGRFLLRQIAMSFDAYLPAKQHGARLI
ncbi:MAG TPA: oxygen-independent coproporphyrinogen III oxidase [Dyella sp.]|uniref:oxygen-independent coproporphyrinogen III oxidase n=1 Tax=Dyella sp. TaxID=1869338 RepID=UPI002CF07B24|nr:oxygen-independent coproporphyrinogen III oxidase [Dyella sp.]HTV84655.1 oxygen-independent coproporphyrinogen III oxidase [Dyella sp.]